MLTSASVVSAADDGRDTGERGRQGGETGTTDLVYLPGAEPVSTLPFSST